MPLQFLDAALEVLLHVVGILVLVVLQHHALQQGLWEGHLAHLLLHIGAQVDQELIVAVALQLWLDGLCNLLTEGLLILHRSLAEHAVEELLVHFCWLEMADLVDLITEVAVQVFHLLLVHFQQGSHLGVVVRIGLLGVEGNHVTLLCSVEEFALLVLLDIGGHNHCSLVAEAVFLRVTLLVEFAQGTCQRIVAAEGLGILEFTSLRSVHLHLVVDEFVVYLDIIIGQLVLVCQFGLHLRSDGNVEHELQVTFLLEVLGLLLLLVRQGLAQHLYLVLLDIAIEFLTNQAVHLVHLRGGTILTLNHSHGHLTRTEPRHLGLLTIVFQCLLNLLLIVCGLDDHSHDAIDFIRAIKCNFHLSLYLIY